LNPLNTHGLKPTRLNTKNGIVEINHEGWIVIELVSRKTISISKNGLKV
jgi:hypothetical protein